MNGFERRTEKKKESIRMAAMELFQKHGFRKVSIGDIARKAHVSHVTIYNHFGSKEELIRDIIKKVSLDLLSKSRAIIDSDRPFLDKLKAIISIKSSTGSDYQGELAKTIANDLPDMKRFIDDLRDKESYPLLDKLIEEGKKLKYINRDLSPRAIRFFFQALRSGIYAEKELLESIKIDKKLAYDFNYLALFGLIEKQE